MKNLKTQLAVLLLSTLCLLTGAFAQSTPSQDSYTFSNKAGQNYGTAPTIQVESALLSHAIANSYIQFDLSSIPSSYTGANVTKASLKLFVNTLSGAGGSFNVDLVNGSWTEFGIRYNNAPALGTTIASSIPLTTANVHDYVIVDVTSAVQAWLDGSQPNDGIALVANSGLGVLFDSKENTATSHPPELDIVFASGGGTITGVTTAPGSGLSGGGTSGTLPLSLIACGTNQVLQYSGASWGCATISGGGGGITGSGTVNSLPLFNGLTSLASSNVSQSGTNIGIGTTTPAATLDVNGAVNAATSFNLGENIFAFGSHDNQNAFLGFAGNSSFLNVGLANTASGYNSLAANTTGSDNTATGDGALFNNTTGGNNMASGVSALVSNTIGNANNASGTESLFNNTMGSANSASGFKALFSNTTGNNNTALGFTAGNPTNSANTTGSNNTFVGSTANPGTQTTLNNATAIGANAQVTASNALVLGSILGTNGCNSPCDNTSVGIGTTAPAFPLDVNGVIRSTGGFMFPDGTVQITKATGGGSGTVTSVGSGLGLTGGPITTTGTLTIDTSVVPLLATNNTFGGAITALSFTGNGAGLTSVNAAALGGFSPSTFATIGANGFSGNQTITGSLFASGNVGIGTTTPQATLDVNGAVNAATSFNLGGNLFAFGSLSNYSAFLGFAGNSNLSKTGAFNTAAGYQALFNTTGYENTASGFDALYSNTTGNDNTAIGNGALFSNTTGSNNTALGSFSGPDLVSLTNSTAIGAFADVRENNALVLGAINGTNGCEPPYCNNTMVGIGTTTPQATLDVEAPSGTTPSVNFGSTSNPAKFIVNSISTSIKGQVSLSDTSGSSSIALNPGGVFLTGALNTLSGPTIINGPLTVTGTCTGCGGGGGGSGTVTSVGTGLGLLGGPITTSGTLSINPSVVPQLGVNNSFTGNNTFTGANKFTGLTTAAAISATSLTANTGGFGPGNIYGNNLYLYTANGPTYPFAYASGSSTDDSVFLGFAGENINQSCPADFNTAIGWRALNVNGPGCGFQAIFNTAVGAQALTNNTLGLANTATGYTALYQNITGNYNAANGDEALYNNTAGNNNTASGHSSLLNTTGSFNTGSGSNALQYNTTGSNNTALGALSGPDSASTGLSYATAIGAGAVVSASNALVLGGPQGSAAAVNVGIGTATPQATLDVVGGANFSGTVTIANLSVTNSLSKPAGTFKIDHPLDPANKYLYHSFVESPDMMNVYNGNISTDGFGLATVTLPDWFEALNRDFRYQLTVIGQFAQAIVASEVSHNQFTIRTDRPNVKVSWQVTGIRQDAYANAHRVQVEEDKPPQDQGHYLHPELFGAAPEQAVGYQAPTATLAAQAPVSTLHQ